MAIDSFRWSGCGDFILTISIAFFYPFGLTSIVMLQCTAMEKIFTSHDAGRLNENVV